MNHITLYFVSFGNRKYRRAKRVLRHQVDALGFFDEIRMYGPRDFEEAFLATPQIAGGIQVLRKCQHSLDVTREWLNLATENYHWIDDSPSHLPNHPDFREHRHDQSIISLLVKNRGALIIPDETYPPGTGPISADRKRR